MVPRGIKEPPDQVLVVIGDQVLVMIKDQVLVIIRDQVLVIIWDQVLVIIRDQVLVIIWDQVLVIIWDQVLVNPVTGQVILLYPLLLNLYILSTFKYCRETGMLYRGNSFMLHITSRMPFLKDSF